jgi:hypothetical protein
MLAEVRQQPATLSDHSEKPAPRVIIVRVGPEMLGQMVDPLRETRDLDIRGPGVLRVSAKLAD